MAGTV